MNAHSSAFDDSGSDAAPMVMEVDIGQPERGGFPHRVIPAVVGGLFAGLLLVGLGCTPFFGGQKARLARIESGQVVHAPKQTGLVASGNAAAQTPSASAGQTIAPGKTVPAKGSAALTAKGVAASGVPALAAASTASGGVASSATGGATKPAHSFRIDCAPAHADDDPSAPKPENVALQGIMAGRNTRSALLNGVLYQEGDAFGSAACPWTIAMINAAGVRIEKSFGDRVCGVTIALQNRTASAKTQ